MHRYLPLTRTAIRSHPPPRSHIHVHMSSPSTASLSSALGRGSWQCLSDHVPPNELSKSSMPVPQGRSSTACCVIGRQLLLFSGEHTPRQPVDSNVYFFDLERRKWNVRSKGADEEKSWPQGRVGHAGASVGSRFIILGGRTGAAASATLSDVWILQADSANDESDPAKWKWTQVTLAQDSAPTPALSYATATGGDGDKLYVFGGCTDDHGRSDQLWELDVSNIDAARWKKLWPHDNASAVDKNTSPCARGGPGLAVLGSSLYLYAGYSGKYELGDLWRWDLTKASNDEAKWECLQTHEESVSAGPQFGGEEKQERPPPRSVTDLVALPDYFGSGRGCLFVFGGENTASAQGHDGAGIYHEDAWIFDVTEKRWIKCMRLFGGSNPVARGWFNSMRGMCNDEVIVFGGFDGQQRRNDVWRWKGVAAAAETQKQ